jgi:CheY-like chemotaxis protein
MRVLIADHDALRSKTLNEACLARGHVVERASQGAAALELALERVPDAVICPIDLAVIDGERFAEILRGNPRTRETSFVFLVLDELDAPLAMDSRDASVVSPWAEEDVLDNLDAIVERGARFGEMRSTTEIEGKLSQISVVDLLQIFQMNQKSGTVRISVPGLSSSAAIVVRDGHVIDASVPRGDGSAVLGEKALYRLIKWNEGRFEFVPGSVPATGRISKPTRVALMEGMRHKDEWDQLVQDLPPLESRLRLVPDPEKIPSDLHPVTREVVGAVEGCRRISAIVDHCSFPDYQVLRCIADLLARGAVEVDKADAEDAPRGVGDGLYNRTQVRRLREWIAAQHPRPGPIVKVLIAACDLGRLGRLLEYLRETTDLVVDGRLVREPARLASLCTLGHLALGEGLSLRLISLPIDPIYQPLWDVACHGMLGAIVLPGFDRAVDVEETDAIAQHLARYSDRPVLHALIDGLGGGNPDSVREHLQQIGAGEPHDLSRFGDLDSLRELFARLLP